MKNRRLQPTKRRLLWILPGILLGITGIVLFVFVETDDNYWYTHSLWHMFMAMSILFFLPQKISKNISIVLMRLYVHFSEENEDRRQRSPSQELHRCDPSVGVINQGAIVTEDENANVTS